MAFRTEIRVYDDDTLIAQTNCFGPADRVFFEADIPVRVGDVLWHGFEYKQAVSALPPADRSDDCG